jgi:hypothetical protein
MQTKSTTRVGSGLRAAALSGAVLPAAVLSAVVLAVAVLTGCGANQAGLKPKAAGDLGCSEKELRTRQVKNGYGGDDFGAQVEVKGCDRKAVYEKKGPGSWVEVDSGVNEDGV